LNSIKTSNGIALDCAIAIFDICHLFIKDFAAVHIIDHKCNALTNGLMEALNHIGKLSVECVAGLIVASFVLG